jgi:hypothetical protein
MLDCANSIVIIAEPERELESACTWAVSDSITY